MPDKFLRKKVEAIKRKKIAKTKVVNLSEFRNLQKSKDQRIILIVDDEEIMRNGLKRILEAEDYKILLAQDGLELSKTLESTRLDMVLLDVNLPWVDGYELCALIKNHHNFKNVPIFLISGRKTKEDIERGFAAGADDYITKPFEVDFITDVIQKKFLEFD